MQRTNQKQKKRGGMKRCEAPKPSESSPLPLEEFFAAYAPRFRYNNTASASSEFDNLCKKLGWDKPKRQEALEKFKEALVLQFQALYGTDVDDLDAWRSLCRVVHIDPVPDGLEACREAVYYTFVNLVDLVDAPITGAEVRTFPSERALSYYTITTRRFFPRDHELAGTLLRYLLRHIFDPRDGYDEEGRWCEDKTHKRRGKRGQRGDSVPLTS